MEKRRHEYNQGKKDAVLPFQHAVPAALTLTNTDYQMKTTRIMNKIIIYLSAVLLLCSCGSARHYAAFQYDNGDDYVSEGLYRIVDRKGRIGYADETGKTVIRPRFDGLACLDRHPSSFCLRLSIRGWQGESHRFGGTERGGRLRQRALVLGK